jgi:glycosyltransferase involved in cell wall biosynthesis
MKILLLHRQPYGGIARHAALLAQALNAMGIEAAIEEASSWIPDDTGIKTDKIVSSKLRAIGKPFDLVHAIGYRAAWACAEAFGYNEAWLYTAYDLPKTTNRLLIDRLNRAQLGLCASHAILTALDHVLALDLSVVSPGVPAARENSPNVADARSKLGLPTGVAIVGFAGRFVPENSVSSLIQSFETVWMGKPESMLAIAGEGPERSTLIDLASRAKHPDKIRIFDWLDDPTNFFAGLDALVVPSTRAGYSMAAVEAMSAGVPALLRASGGLLELADQHISGFFFDSDEELGSRITELLEMPVTLESVGQTARLRVLERFTLEQCVESVADAYRSICQDV